MLPTHKQENGRAPLFGYPTASHMGARRGREGSGLGPCLFVTCLLLGTVSVGLTWGYFSAYSRLQHLQHEFDVRGDEVHHLQDEVQHIRNLLHSSEVRYSDLQRSFDVVKRQSDDYKFKSEKLSQEVMEKQRRITELEAAHQVGHGNLQQELQTAKATVESLQHQNHELTVRIDQMTREFHAHSEDSRQREARLHADLLQAQAKVVAAQIPTSVPTTPVPTTQHVPNQAPIHVDPHAHVPLPTDHHHIEIPKPHAATAAHPADPGTGHTEHATGHDAHTPPGHTHDHWDHWNDHFDHWNDHWYDHYDHWDHQHLPNPHGAMHEDHQDPAHGLPGGVNPPPPVAAHHDDAYVDHMHHDPHLSHQHHDVHATGQPGTHYQQHHEWEGEWKHAGHEHDEHHHTDHGWEWGHEHNDPHHWDVPHHEVHGNMHDAGHHDWNAQHDVHETAHQPEAHDHNEIHSGQRAPLQAHDWHDWHAMHDMHDAHGWDAHHNPPDPWNAQHDAHAQAQHDLHDYHIPAPFDPHADAHGNVHQDAQGQHVQDAHASHGVPPVEEHHGSWGWGGHRHPPKVDVDHHPYPAQHPAPGQHDTSGQHEIKSDLAWKMGI